MMSARSRFAGGSSRGRLGGSLFRRRETWSTDRVGIFPPMFVSVRRRRRSERGKKRNNNTTSKLPRRKRSEREREKIWNFSQREVGRWQMIEYRHEKRGKSVTDVWKQGREKPEIEKERERDKGKRNRATHCYWERGRDVESPKWGKDRVFGPHTSRPYVDIPPCNRRSAARPEVLSIVTINLEPMRKTGAKWSLQNVKYLAKTRVKAFASRVDH